VKSHAPAVILLLCLALDPNEAQCEEIALVYPAGEAKARLVGRFFAGTRRDSPNGLGWYLWGGYGHFGMCTLLVVQQVVSVEARQKPANQR
jgi:hypothetical protein